MGWAKPRRGMGLTRVTSLRNRLQRIFLMALVVSGCIWHPSYADFNDVIGNVLTFRSDDISPKLLPRKIHEGSRVCLEAQSETDGAATTLEVKSPDNTQCKFGFLEPSTDPTRWHATTRQTVGSRLRCCLEAPWEYFGSMNVNVYGVPGFAWDLATIPPDDPNLVNTLGWTWYLLGDISFYSLESYHPQSPRSAPVPLFDRTPQHVYQKTTVDLGPNRSLNTWTPLEPVFAGGGATATLKCGTLKFEFDLVYKVKTSDLTGIEEEVAEFVVDPAVMGAAVDLDPEELMCDIEVSVLGSQTIIIDEPFVLYDIESTTSLRGGPAGGEPTTIEQGGVNLSPAHLYSATQPDSGSIPRCEWKDPDGLIFTTDLEILDGMLKCRTPALDSGKQLMLTTYLNGVTGISDGLVFSYYDLPTLDYVKPNALTPYNNGESRRVTIYGSGFEPSFLTTIYCRLTYTADSPESSINFLWPSDGYKFPGSAFSDTEVMCTIPLLQSNATEVFFTDMLLDVTLNGQVYSVVPAPLEFYYSCPLGTQLPTAKDDILRCEFDCTVSSTPPQSSVCEYCQPGYYIPSMDTRKCLACERGRYTDATAATACEPCTIGEEKDIEGPGSCTGCSPGRYAPTIGTPKCVDCPAGLYSPFDLAVRCSSCPTSKYSEGGSSSCTKCEPGYIQPSARSSSCIFCAAGRFKDSESSTACSVCAAGKYSGEPASETCDSCKTGFYGPRAGMSACFSCPEGAYVDRVEPSGHMTIDECKCKPGFYGSAKLGACTQCNSAMECEELWVPVGDEEWHGYEYPAAKPGYWVAVGKASVIACDPRGSCPGGFEQCNAEYTGEACGECASRHYRLNGKCEACASDGIPIPVIIFIVVAILFLPMIFRLKRTGDRAKTSMGDIMGLGKTTVNFIQVIGVFAALELNWSDEFKEIFEVALYFQFSIELAQPECQFSGWDFRTKYFVTMALPIVFSVVLLVLGLLIFGHAVLMARVGLQMEGCLGRLSQKPIKTDNDSAGWMFFSRLRYTTFSIFHKGFDLTELRKARDGFIQVLLQFLNILYIQLVKASLSWFGCSERDGRWVLDANPATNCYEGEWNDYLPGAIASNLVFCLGLPIMFLIILWKNRDMLDDETTIVRYSFLFQRYENKFMWWEVVIMTRKLGLVIATTFWRQDVFVQTLFAISVLFLGLLLQAYARPFIRQNNDVVETSFLITSVILLVVGWFSTINKVDPNTVSTLMKLALFLFGCSFIILIIAICYELRDTLKARQQAASVGSHVLAIKLEMKRRRLEQAEYKALTYGERKRLKEEEKIHSKRKLQRKSLALRAHGFSQEEAENVRLKQLPQHDTGIIWLDGKKIQHMLTHNELEGVKAEGASAKSHHNDLQKELHDLRSESQLLKQQMESVDSRVAREGAILKEAWKDLSVLVDDLSRFTEPQEVLEYYAESETDEDEPNIRVKVMKERVVTRPPLLDMSIGGIEVPYHILREERSKTVEGVLMDMAFRKAVVKERLGLYLEGHAIRPIETTQLRAACTEDQVHMNDWSMFIRQHLMA